MFARFVWLSTLGGLEVGKAEVVGWSWQKPLLRYNLWISLLDDDGLFGLFSPRVQIAALALVVFKCLLLLSFEAFG